MVQSANHNLDAIPTAPTLRVRDFLERYRGARIFHPPLSDDRGVLLGNNGDHLMALGTEVVYRDFAIERVDCADKADLLVLGANGGLLDIANHVPRLFRTLSQNHPHQPLCVLPSTWYYPTRRLSDELGTRTAPATLFCREPYSYHHLRNEHEMPACCTVELDYDLAFEIEDGAMVQSYRGREAKHVLLVERTDVEHPSVALQSARLGWRRHISKHLPAPIKRALYPMVSLARGRRMTPWRRQCVELLHEHCPQYAALPVIARDVSNINASPFEEFCTLIAEAAVIFTTRLHAGIFAALVDRPTFIFGGPYHKIKGIYEFSLAGRNNIHFVEPRQ